MEDESLDVHMAMHHKETSLPVDTEHSSENVQAGIDYMEKCIQLESTITKERNKFDKALETERCLKETAIKETEELKTKIEKEKGDKSSSENKLIKRITEIEFKLKDSNEK